MTIVTTDPAALSAPPAAGQDAIIAKVRAQLQRDFPDGALTWLDDLAWRGPVNVPLSSLDFTRSKSWASSKSPAKVQAFTKRIQAGWRKPIVLVKDSTGKITPVDGHTRLLGYQRLGLPALAWVGFAKTAHGPWEGVHARQK